MATFVPFDLERWQGDWENRVTHNLAESGVHPLSLGELLEITDTDPAALHDVRLGYGETTGNEVLRTAIAGLYPGADLDSDAVEIGLRDALSSQDRRRRHARNGFYVARRGRRGPPIL